MEQKGGVAVEQVLLHVHDFELAARKDLQDGGDDVPFEVQLVVEREIFRGGESNRGRIEVF